MTILLALEALDVEKATFSQLLRRYLNFWVTFGRKK